MRIPPQPRKILIVRLSALGDLVVLTPIFRRLREKFPETEIDVLVKQEIAAVVANNPFITNVLTFTTSTGFCSWRRLCWQLAERGYDLFIDMHRNLRSFMLGWYLSRTPRLLYHKPRLLRLLLFYCWWNRFPRGFRLLDSYLTVLKPLVIATESNTLTEIFLPEETSDNARLILERHGIKSDYIVLLPIATWPNKLYPLERYSEIARRINIELKMSVVWLGGQNDEHLKRLNYMAPGQSVRIMGETTLPEALGIISLSRAVIGNDTGLTYAAEALGVPTVLIMGPTAHETGAGTYHPTSVEVFTKVWCRPCSQKGDRLCYRRQRYCMERISSQQVWEALQSILRSRT